MAKQKAIIAINLGNYGSTGRIMKEIGDSAEDSGFRYYYAYPASSLNKKKGDGDIIICSPFFRKVAEKMSIITGIRGIWLPIHTLLFLRKIRKIRPFIIHLHNLHDSYINLSLLFRYIKKSNIKVVWTLHDCWSFTGRCPHFQISKCSKWKEGCYSCEYPRSYYPRAYIDKTNVMWKLKKRWFTGVSNLTIVTPSNWLSGLVAQSFLGQYPIITIYNGIDLNVFKYTASNFKQRYNCQDSKVLLGVAFDWSYSKGLDIFIDLSKKLNDSYQVVLVGTTDEIDELLPKNIISIHRTSNQTELVEIYSAADFFINPTREEVFGLVNVEALACGTPVITFNTGGCPETIDSSCGIVVNNTVDSIIEAVLSFKVDSKTTDACIKRASNFDIDKKFNEYIDLYNDIIK